MLVQLLRKPGGCLTLTHVERRAISQYWTARVGCAFHVGGDRCAKIRFDLVSAYSRCISDAQTSTFASKHRILSWPLRQKSSTMTSLCTMEGKSFPFFNLPRELRDMVYENLREEECYIFEQDSHSPKHHARVNEVPDDYRDGPEVSILRAWRGMRLCLYLCISASSK